MPISLTTHGVPARSRRRPCLESTAAVLGVRPDHSDTVRLSVARAAAARSHPPRRPRPHRPAVCRALPGGTDDPWTAAPPVLGYRPAAAAGAERAHSCSSRRRPSAHAPGIHERGRASVYGSAGAVGRGGDTHHLAGGSRGGVCGGWLARWLCGQYAWRCNNKGRGPCNWIDRPFYSITALPEWLWIQSSRAASARKRDQLTA